LIGTVFIYYVTVTFEKISSFKDQSTLQAEQAYHGLQPLQRGIMIS